MTFLCIVPIIICPMWLVACSCEVDSVVGKIQSTVVKPLLDMRLPTQVQVAYLQKCPCNFWSWDFGAK